MMSDATLIDFSQQNVIFFVQGSCMFCLLRAAEGGNEAARWNFTFTSSVRISVDTSLVNPNSPTFDADS